MTETELIARQAKEVEELRDEVADLKKRVDRARSHIYCIGGPLNDNRLGYSKQQRETFLRIADEFDGGGRAADDWQAALIAEGENAARYLAALTVLCEAVKPFAAIINETSGRIPTERLSLANWHDLVKAFNESPNVEVSRGDTTPDRSTAVDTSARP